MIEDPRRYVRMTNFIRARIEDGTYKPDELIPTINKLTAETGYSRHTITKALRTLQQEGLVARIPGLGYAATSKPTPNHPRQPIVVPITDGGRSASLLPFASFPSGPPGRPVSSGEDIPG